MDERAGACPESLYPLSWTGRGGALVHSCTSERVPGHSRKTGHRRPILLSQCATYPTTYSSQYGSSEGPKLKDGWSKQTRHGSYTAQHAIKPASIDIRSTGYAPSHNNTVLPTLTYMHLLTPGRVTGRGCGAARAAMHVTPRIGDPGLVSLG